MSLQNCNVLVAATGSVAAIRIPRLVNLLLKHGANVKLLLTSYASNFIELEAPLPNSVQVLSDSDEWHVWTRKSDPVLHIDLVKWAHLYLIAPLSANTMAKLANGLCDNLVTSVARAWPFDHKPLVVAPAMNTNMWTHPISKPQIQTLKSFGVRVIEPIKKTLACGDTGVGAMQEPLVIVQTLIHLLESTNNM